MNKLRNKQIYTKFKRKNCYRIILLIPKKKFKIFKFSPTNFLCHKSYQILNTVINKSSKTEKNPKKLNRLILKSHSYKR